MRGTLMLCILFAFVSAGCEGVYYSTMEALGQPKRQILVERVEKARDEQEAAKEQFRSALERFSSVVNFDGGDLERMYETLESEYDSSMDRASAVSERIDQVESVAMALFEEWEAELGEYSSTELRRSSEAKLESARSAYERLMRAMRAAESRMEPVLGAFKDQVLYIKHNLNARAVASLKGELISVEQNVSDLIASMEASIDEANEFIRRMTLE